MKGYKHILNTLRLNKMSRWGAIRLAILFTVLCVSGLIGMNTLGAHAKSSCTGTAYNVVRGDTLSGIAQKKGLNWKDLAKLNGLANPDLIFAGQEICLSGKAVSGAPSKPTTTPTTTSTPTQSKSVEGMIDDVFGTYAPAAKRVAMCESTMNPNATNSISIGGSHAAGVFQILYPSTWNTTSQASKSPYDAQANIQAAYEIFSRDGYSWREWACQP
ncbi:hypothetical protein KSX_07430 [Ktedonospora formicarum]|uniref:LysM domain-containing protein n=1 Tax=Ktedonospora formicarum TaxID=2778364 RepID=A0A8J3MP61_9CHLR|nr:hypothetical protein KSX_07430 [Ktedonospora formicarum]